MEIRPGTVKPTRLSVYIRERILSFGIFNFGIFIFKYAGLTLSRYLYM